MMIQDLVAHADELQADVNFKVVEIETLKAKVDLLHSELRYAQDERDTYKTAFFFVQAQIKSVAETAMASMRMVSDRVIKSLETTSEVLEGKGLAVSKQHDEEQNAEKLPEQQAEITEKPKMRDVP